ncbi:hypothetical protein TTHERM_00494830 (macronuclear) [Tetrahymena thermophila SB210]|uniref:Uncharacterized protein n=1 Tax=Tetrahymena thermophila (strain SB210) TaxID=312017 RepID=I7MHJ2_TETTS|nr:hypothetical protein TTHERM_00494830 [Tetrahymena thermophila SB210]EAS03021.1 hypothetical protein TTHERM_00494830 [Tetrahymena thermophila SB210]|eukprot:XP_001023266.1 hypothetical protein TTHERM_00494830 [Tetrahymena thermophila SB210]
MATKLFKTIKKKAGRLQDIVSVLQKLEEKKYIERLSKIFEEIFYEEQKFTITELQRIMSSKPANKYLDLDEQFKQNTQLFKANFEAINSILINEVWDNITATFSKPNEGKQQVYQDDEFQDRGRPQTSAQHQYSIAEDQQHQQQQQYQTVESVANENEQHQIYQTAQSYEQQHAVSSGNNNNNSNTLNNDSKILNKVGLAKSQLINNSSYSMNTSYSQQNHNENWVRTNMKKRNSSRSQENLKLSQTGNVNDSQYAKRMNSMNNSTFQNKTNTSIIDIKKAAEKKLNSTNLSISSVKSLSQSKLGMPPPFSEFPEQKNPLSTSFSRAPRKLLDKELSQSPGPSDYRVEKADKLTRKQSPKASFGNTIRTNFVDEKHRIESCAQTPGPQYNVSQTNIYKPMKK